MDDTNASENNAKVISKPFPKENEKSLLREWWHSILRENGKYSCYATFLVLQSDKETFRYLNEYGSELDILSGEDCLIVAISESEFWHPVFGSEEWNLAVKGLFSKSLSVQVARIFNVKFTDFPCVLFFKDIREQEHIIVHLADLSAEEIASELRKVFSIIHIAVQKKVNPIKALSLQNTREDLKHKGNNIISGVSSFAGKTIETAMEAFIGTLIK